MRQGVDMRTRLRNERGAALLEAAITVPIILLICVGIFEFGRAYQVQQILTNAVREGARAAVIEGTSDERVSKIVTDYMASGNLPVPAAPVTIDISRAEPFGGTTASKVTVTFPYKFMVIGGVVKLVAPKSTLGSTNLNMQATALMRNE
jgi:Flp pilus assembly protein TadG